MNVPRAETPGTHDGAGEDEPEPPVLPDRPTDEHDEAWGESDRRGERDRDWYERERPPHHE
ncbi:MAG TPA: hypothetical protein VE074_15905 [Jatrophihabitantaceae bacterium]|nr:hypothetical protein [Jatrophihabitantaceae bacterium]